jgi:hypothetical protein
MRFKFLFLTGLLIPLSCQKGEVDSLPESESGVLNHVSLGVKDVDLSDISPATRTEIEITNTVSFSWSSTDVVGMFPNRGAQAYFEMAGHDGESTAEFDGGGWALKSASEYAVYYPYDYDHRDRSSIPFNYQGQKQRGKGDYSHLADWQFLAQGMKQPEGGACNYSMERIESIVWFHLTIPSIVSCDKLTVSTADGLPIVVGTTLDISETQYIIHPCISLSHFSLEVEDVSTTVAGETVDFYAMMPPQNLKDHTIIISVHTTEGDNLLGAVNGKDMVANHAYYYEATLTCDYASFMEKFGIEDGFWE